MSRSVVITGSTRGFGHHLAAAFLARDCQVVISGRVQQAVDDILAELVSKYSREQIFSVLCDVNNFDQVQELWNQAKSHYGKVDIWINNAGITAPMTALWELSANKYEEVVHTNIIGVLYGTKVALNGMLAQGFGALYNLEGFGARGNSMRGAALYGSTKSAVHFIDRSLARETQGTPVITGAISPGMMITDLVTRQFEGKSDELNKVKGILNIIAERPEIVAPVLVEKILKNRKNGVTIRYGSTIAMLLKFLTMPFKKRDLFSPQLPNA